MIGIAWGVGCAALPTVTVTDAAEVAFFRHAVERLASPDMEGRGLGSAGLDRARDYLIAQLQALPLTPAFGDAYAQPFDATLPDFVREHRQRLLGEGTAPLPATVPAANVAAILPGAGPLQREVVVVAAHYDHLGYGDRLTYGQTFEPVLHPGADDNASGVAAVLLLAQRLATRPPPAPRRAVLFVFFTGEELGLLGSRYFVAHRDDHSGTSRGVAVLNLDMVGRLEGHALQILGVGASPSWKPLLRTAAAATNIRLLLRNPADNRSDLRPFIEARIPGVHLFTGPHDDYHRPSDTADKLDAPGAVHVVNFTQVLVHALATGAAPGFTLPPSDDAPSDP